MNFNQKNLYFFIKRSIQRLFFHYGHTSIYVDYSDQEASNKIKDMILSDQPFLICRFGSTELQCLAAYQNEIKFLKSNSLYSYYHWNDVIYYMCNYSGFFPNDKKLIYDFCELMLNDLKDIDLLGSWRKEEYYLKNRLTQISRIRLRDIEPYFHDKPWSSALKGKKVLVIHPFEQTIRSQYKRNYLLFKNKEVLPKFDLKTIKAVQSIAGNITEFDTWFDALDSMKRQIDTCEFDIALIGCGAYGLPLAAHVKRKGKKAIHMGGAVQLLFGIMGKRWEVKKDFAKLSNEYWVYPLEGDTPKNNEMVEGGTYWK